MQDRGLLTLEEWTLETECETYAIIYLMWLIREHTLYLTQRIGLIKDRAVCMHIGGGLAIVHWYGQSYLHANYL